MSCVLSLGYLHYLNDQLGTPQELITANGDIVWSGVYKSYGNLAIEYRTVPQNLRFQGQYFDEESGLHYNRYRYYDPYTARYISQDPIGLVGGENAYSYVPDPLAWIDPLGLTKICPVREVNGTKIYGKGQVDSTPGHDQFSEAIANKLAMSGQFTEIYLNRSYNMALKTKASARRPDIMAIDKNGKVHAIELASKTDKNKLESLIRRNKEAMEKLGSYREDAISLFEHPYNARDIKHRLDLLIKGIKEGN
nr:RHS repeat-associated core domain-containing protein [Gilliamella apicola]